MCSKHGLWTWVLGSLHQLLLLLVIYSNSNSTSNIQFISFLKFQKPDNGVHVVFGVHTPFGSIGSNCQNGCTLQMYGVDE